jgi:glutaredoxin-like protein
MRSEGERVPDVLLRKLDNGKPVTVSTRDLFAGRSVVVFALPGAFTPTCSSQHLPQYEELAPDLRAAGIDEIVCISVNDPYVLAEWGAQQQLREVQLLSDGNGEFSEAMGMLIDHRDLGMALRSRRYSMVVRDGRIEKIFAEPEQDGDPYSVSDAATMLRYLAPDRACAPRIAMLSKPGCPYCAQARSMLDEHGLHYTDLPLPDATRSRLLGAIAGADTAPQVFADGHLIGGSEQLSAWLQQRSR